MYKYILIVFVLITNFSLKSHTLNYNLCYVDSVENNCVIVSVSEQTQQPNPVFKLFKKKQRLNKRITAAALAFPFPFGIVGLHRIYLGTKPHVPVVYIGSLGGIFGLLPLIDFIAIATTKDFEHYRDNGNVFMWIKD